MIQLPNFVGVNATVNGNTIVTTSGFPPLGNFEQGAFSTTGYLGVTVSAVQGAPGSDAMALGLNLTSAFVPSSVAAPGLSTYLLYFHSDVGQYNVFANGVLVFTPSAAPVTGDVGALTYNGTSVVFTINGITIFTAPVPIAEQFQLLYVMWSSFYLGATVTLGVVPFSLPVSPFVAPYEKLITSEHNQKPDFMSVIDVVVGAAADAAANTLAIQPSFVLDSAVGAQLDILGLWIGQSRKIDNILVIGFFGFSEVSTGLPDGLQETFGEVNNSAVGGIWFSLGQADSGSTILNDQAYLTILKARIVKNQWDGTVGGMEEALQFIVGVACAVIDHGNLTLSVNVPLPITPLEEALLESLDLIPRPAGVAITSITFAP